MDEEKKEKKDSKDSNEKKYSIKDIMSWFEETKRAWEPQQFEWFKYKNFRDGNHHTYIDKNGNVVQKNGLSIPLCGLAVQIIQNHLLRDAFRWSFEPSELSEEAEAEALKLGKVMDKYYEILNMEALLRNFIDDASTYSAGVAFVGWDECANDGRGDVVVKVENPFYFLPDPTATDLSNARFVFRIVDTTLEAVRSNPKYDQNLVKTLNAETKLGATSIVEDVIQRVTKQGNKQVAGNDALGRFFLLETYIREYIEVEGEDVLNEGRMVKKKVPRIRLVVSGVSQKVKLYDEVTDLEDYPFELLYADKDNFSMFGVSPMKKLIPMNQALNELTTQKLEYMTALRYGGYYAVDKGIKVELKNKNGMQVIEYDGKGRPIRDVMTPISLPNLPQGIDSLSSSLETWIKLAAGTPDVMYGIAPGANIANSAIENLIAQGTNSTVEFQKNLKDFNERVALKMLWNIAKYNVTGRVLQIDTEGGEKEQVTIIGKDAPLSLHTQDNGAYRSDILRVGEENNVRCTSESSLNFTEQARQELILKMFSLVNPKTGEPLLDEETVLQTLKFGNVKEIIERKEVNAQKHMSQEQALQQQQQQFEQQMQEMQQQHAQEMEMLKKQLEGGVDYTDAPEDVRRQMEAMEGYQPSQEMATEPNSLSEYGMKFHLRKYMAERNAEAQAKTQGNIIQEVVKKQMEPQEEMMEE